MLEFFYFLKYYFEFCSILSLFEYNNDKKLFKLCHLKREKY